MEKQKSVGVSFFGFAFLIVGAILSYTSYLSSKGASNNYEFAIAIFGIIQGIAFVISGIGVLCLKRWSIYLVIAIALVSICKTIWTMHNCLSSTFGKEEIVYIFYYLSPIIFNAIIIFFFTRPKVKEQFK